VCGLPLPPPSIPFTLPLISRPSDTKFSLTLKTLSLLVASPWIPQNNSSILRSRPSSRRSPSSRAMPSSVRLKHVAPLSLLFSLVAAQGNNFTCIPLKGSTLCPSFSEASISTSLTANFPFLQYVANLEEFDTQFATYIKTDYVKYAR
jgi:hypothetical protein